MESFKTSPRMTYASYLMSSLSPGWKALGTMQSWSSWQYLSLNFHAGADWMLQTWDRFCRTWNYATFMNFDMFCLHISLQLNADPGSKPFESGQSAQWFPSNMFFYYSHVICDTTFHEPRNLNCHQSAARLRGQIQYSFNEIFMNYGHT